MEPNIFVDLIELRKTSGEGLAKQIYRQIRRAILEGILPASSFLPSTRQLAIQLKVSRSSINEAFELLAAEGLIELRFKARAKVNSIDVAPVGRVGLHNDLALKNGVSAGAGYVSKRGEQLGRSYRFEPRGMRSSRMVPGMPSVKLFPKQEWARALRQAGNELSLHDSGYLTSSGLAYLKEVLSGYLSEYRGVNADAEQIIIVPGTQAALTLAAYLYADLGDTALIEDPGYLGARAAFLNSGLLLKASRANDLAHNIRQLAQQECAARLVYVTPSHQFPQGGVLALKDRLALLEAARASGAMIIEDDYDSEFLHYGRPIVALQGLSKNGEVTYIGTTAKSLIPALRLAYMVVRREDVCRVAHAQRNLGLLANAHSQLALAHFIEDGAFRRHLRRITRHYSATAEILWKMLIARFPDKLIVEKPSAGVQMCLLFTGEWAVVNDKAIANKLNDVGFGVNPLSIYCYEIEQSGLIVGTADTTLLECEQFCDALARACVAN
ncbi:PLP-dependent aminotransferase family protein [Polycladidibacter stylochi]|uniref:aminotransferase-like domain-containing protein n=1 Tax=Polycladidibacter stylochi TaxID=1807766 RepID=UPI0008333DBD|nr:PLP-dependent aminotransferase family protein [Pseudovibrio stylochi]